MTSDELKVRTKKFALRIIKLVESLPKNNVSKVIGNQLLRSATSVGANYRAACRSRSKMEFISRVKIVEEESDESMYWLELIMELNFFRVDRVANIMEEANELTAIFTSTIITSKRNLYEQKSKIKNQKSKIKNQS